MVNAFFGHFSSITSDTDTDPGTKQATGIKRHSSGYLLAHTVTFIRKYRFNIQMYRLLRAIINRDAALKELLCKRRRAQQQLEAAGCNALRHSNGLSGGGTVMMDVVKFAF